MWLVVMETVKVVVILLLLLLSDVLCQELDEENWRGGREENKLPNSEDIQNIFVRLLRKPGARQNLGKNLSGKMQPTRKRRKFQTFVGLMGKRSFSDEGFLRTAQETENY